MKISRLLKEGTVLCKVCSVTKKDKLSVINNDDDGINDDIESFLRYRVTCCIVWT